MKKLKWFLMISIFVILCMLIDINVYASTYNLDYSSSIKQCVTDRAVLLDNIADYVVANASTLQSQDNVLDIVNDKVTIIYSDICASGSGNWFYVYLNYGDTSFSYWSYNIYSAISYLVHFDSSYNIIDFTRQGVVSTSTGFYPEFSFYFDYRLGSNTDSIVVNNTSESFYFPSADENYVNNMNLNTFNSYLDYEFIPAPSEPSYTYISTILDNGSVQLDFSFSDYNEGSIYGFTISNEISNEEYGIVNPFDDIFPNIIPYGNSYSIIVPYDTYIYITLAEYNQVEDTDLYLRDEIYTDIIDINNVVFNNSQSPYFQVTYQTRNTIRGIYRNTKNGYSCMYKYSNDNVINVISCNDEQVYDIIDFNGYIEFYIENSSGTRIYDRKINFLAGADNLPYIKYQVVKQDFYSVVNWQVINDDYDINLMYRYSIDNGVTYTQWTLYDNNSNNSINIFSNSVVIIELSNHLNTLIYDSKSIVVVTDISNIKSINNSSSNVFDFFDSIFSVNPNIKDTIVSYWNVIKNSKIYLIIIIPFITMIMCAIIRLIRRQ